MSRIIREARPTDMAEIMKVMDAAKLIMRQSGNMHQWGDGYPSEADIACDMERRGAFVVEDCKEASCRPCGSPPLPLLLVSFVQSSFGSYISSAAIGS